MAAINILLVEDNEYDAEIIVDTLQSHDLDFVARRIDSASAFKALLAERAPIDLILSDYTLPQFRAPEVLQLLKASERDIPLIIITGTISEETAVECMRLGASDYLLKDRLARLGQAVRNALAAKEARDEARQSEAALRHSEAFNRAILESLSTQIAALDSTGVIIAINEAWRKFGRENGDPNLVFTGIGVNYLDVCKRAASAGDTGAQVAYDGIVRVLNGQEMIFATEYPCVTPAEERWFLMRVAPLADSSGGAVISHHDITEQRRAEMSRLHAERLNMELDKERELRQLKDQFISTLSHDFRTPLSVIQVNSDLLSSYYDRLGPEKRLAYLDGIKAQIKILVGMIDDVLVINRAQTGRLACTPVPMNLTQFCETLITQTHMANAVEQRIRMTVHGDTAEVALDEKLLRHILTNLMTNALKYSPNGESVQLDVDAGPDHVVFSITDHGIGIPVEDQKHLFTPFYRGANTGKISGTGLGLAIVKSSVEAHGGTISVVSELGKGSTFRVSLPNGQVPVPA
jgi:signal transduction histidine kinase/CheY-like chemotaxis protein